MEILKDFLRPEIIWFLIGIVLLTMEFASPGLVIFFFGVGACVTAITCLIFKELAINNQLFIFIGASVLSLLCLRRWLKGIFIGHVTSEQDMTDNTNEFIGQKATVKTAIDSKLGGKVELHGTDWQAVSDEDIAEGTVVEIIDKDNLTLKVKAI